MKVISVSSIGWFKILKTD